MSFTRRLYGVGALFWGLASYLGWQARIKSASYEDMFAIRQCAESQPDRRFIPLTGAANFRHIGSYKTQDGRCVRDGAVYRSDNLSRLTDADLADLTHLEIRLICDLRNPDERRRHPDRVPEGAMIRHIPVAKNTTVNIATLFARHRLDRILKWHYRHMIIDRGAPAIGDVLKHVTDPANLPMIIHCTGGKDRTGIVIALLLHICGVPRATIVSDYTLTNHTIEQLLTVYRTTIHRYHLTSILKAEQLYPMLSARAELIEHALDHIETTYGSVDHYLQGPVELTPTDMVAIRENLLI